MEGREIECEVRSRTFLYHTGCWCSLYLYQHNHFGIYLFSCFSDYSFINKVLTSSDRSFLKGSYKHYLSKKKKKLYLP